jgi:hypothetical protein
MGWRGKKTNASEFKPKEIAKLLRESSACFKNGGDIAGAVPQGLKPGVFLVFFGLAEAVPLLQSRFLKHALEAVS